jgi:hypothetical protein
MSWPFWILIILSPFTFLGVAVSVSFACGLLADPKKEPVSDPKAGWD